MSAPTDAEIAATLRALVALYGTAGYVDIAVLRKMVQPQEGHQEGLQHGYAERPQDHSDELAYSSNQVAAIIAGHVAAERERCAQAIRAQVRDDGIQDNAPLFNALAAILPHSP